VKDATGQSLAYVYGRETKADADIAKVLTMDEARRIPSNIASSFSLEWLGKNSQESGSHKQGGRCLALPKLNNGEAYYGDATVARPAHLIAAIFPFDLLGFASNLLLLALGQHHPMLRIGTFDLSLLEFTV
jgi:hypothetical protein